MNMAQPSVAREPSMEEILASIRRIIESNDPGGSQSVSSSLPPVYGGDEEEADGDIRLTIDDEDAYAAAEMVAANDAGPSFAAAPAQTASAEAEKVKSISLADLAARVRSASERVERASAVEPPAAPVAAAPAPVAATPVTPRAESPVMTTRMIELRAATPRPTEPRLEIPMPNQPLAITEQADLEAAALPDVAVAEPEAPAVTAVEPVVQPAGQDLKAIVSAATVEQVSRSFGELAAALDGQQHRSIDEMAEEMLRPMLQEWLDDNLPTLVERLVREEIERVARGPRR